MHFFCDSFAKKLYFDVAVVGISRMMLQLLWPGGMVYQIFLLYKYNNQ